MVLCCWLFVYGYHNRTLDVLRAGEPHFTFLLQSSPCTLYMYPPLWLSVKQYFTSFKPCQDVRFWRVLICILNIPNAGHFVNFWYTYMNDFYFHCHDKDLWSSLLCRLYRWWNMSHIFFPLLYNTAVVLCCIPPTQCKVLLLLYYYYYRWVDCLETKCRFLMETDSLESIEFLC